MAGTGTGTGTEHVAGVEVDTRHWIGGERVASESTFDDVSPLDGQVIARVSRGGPAEVDAAVAAATAAFPTWAAMPPAERAAILHRVADGVEKRIEDLAQVETRDNGSLLRSHRRGVMPRVAMNIRFFADHLLHLSHPDFETRGHRNHVTWDPAGVTAIVTPWNAPLMLATWRIGPALAAGNTVVAKPPEWAPLTASLFADIAHEAGLPAGVFNVVQGFGIEAGAPLVAHRDVRRVCFTGSVPTSVKIGEAAARNVTPVSFELGGKSPLLVFDDAELDLAVDLAVEQFDNSGQVCLAAVRILVQDGIYDAFRERFLESAAAVVQGDSRDETVDIGPLVGRTHLDRVDGFVQRAKAEGARVVLGGEPNTRAQRADRWLLLPADRVRGRRPVDGDHLPGGLRTRAHPPALRQRGRGRERWPTTPTTAWPRPSSPVTRTAPSAWPAGSGPARSGSTASSSATSPRRSAEVAGRESVARAAPGRSTSTATSRTRSTHREDGS